VVSTPLKHNSSKCIEDGIRDICFARQPINA